MKFQFQRSPLAGFIWLLFVHAGHAQLNNPPIDIWYGATAGQVTRNTLDGDADPSTAVSAPNGVWDLREPTVTANGETLIPASVSLWTSPGHPAATVTFAIQPENTNGQESPFPYVRAWTDASRTTPYTNRQLSISAGGGSVSTTFYLEGFNNTSSYKTPLIIVRHDTGRPDPNNPGHTYIGTATGKGGVWEADLDIDSDNNGNINSSNAAHSTTSIIVGGSGDPEDQMEASTDSSILGKVVVSSQGFAAGLDLEGAPVHPPNLIPMKINLSPQFLADPPSRTKVTLTYENESVPREAAPVSTGGANPYGDIKDNGATAEPRYELQKDGLRLWRKNGVRNRREIRHEVPPNSPSGTQAPETFRGDFIPSGREFLWSDLDQGNVYIEFVCRPGTSLQGKKLITLSVTREADPTPTDPNTYTQWEYDPRNPVNYLSSPKTCTDSLNVCLLSVEIIVRKKGEAVDPKGVLVKKGDVLEIALAESWFAQEKQFENLITWQYQQMKLDGTFEGWTDFGNQGKGTKFEHTTALSGIFELKAVIGSAGSTQDQFYQRKKDDPHSAHKKGENDCFGVADDQWQINVRQQAWINLGSTAYARAVKNGPVPAGPPGGWKCNLFVAHKETDGGATVPWINSGWVHSFPPSANQWAGTAGTEQKNIPNWSLLGADAKPQPGYVVARGASTGHTGILDYDGAWISAGELNVNRKADLREPYYQPALVRKYTGN